MKMNLGAAAILAVVGILIGVVIIPAIAQGGGSADIPNTISYQGYLEDKNTGDPITNPATITFSLYTEISGGTLVWSEMHTGVQPSNGLFSVELGGNGSPIYAAMLDGDRYLGVEVNTDGEMTPRQKVTSVPWALVAEQANYAFSLSAPDGDPQNAVYVDNAGKVGIGTGTPTAELEVGPVGPARIKASLPMIKGDWNTSGNSRDVYISGNYAYVADYSGVKIIDISDPSFPSLEGTYVFMSRTNPWGVYISGKYAYVADQQNSLRIIDISNPGSPVLEETCGTPDAAYGVCVSGKYAYVADYGSGLQIIDISDPSSPFIEGYCFTPGVAYGVYVSGRYAYVADYGSGLQIIDISDPSAPSLEGTYNTTGYARDVYVSGKYAYVADGSSGLQIIDISDPGSPVLEGTCDTSDVANGIYVSGKYAYVADGSSGLQIIDISDPSSPSYEGSCNTPDAALGVYVSGKYAYVADDSSGLQIIDISGIDTPTISTGNVSTSDITVTEKADIGNSLYVRNGVNVGPGGLYVDAGNGIATDGQIVALGNVGIGTTNLNYPLSIRGTGTNNELIGMKNSAGTTKWHINMYGDGFNLAETGVADYRLYVDTGGNIGLGTGTPGADKLDVRGRAYASGGWQTTDADYAEWFEKEGKASPGDIIGINMETGRARTYQPGDRFIGICSTNPAFVGNRTLETDEEMEENHVLAGLLGQLEFDAEQVVIKGRIVATSDGQEVGILLSNGKVLVGR